jgi:hypothetical protein
VAPTAAPTEAPTNDLDVKRLNIIMWAVVLVVLAVVTAFYMLTAAARPAAPTSIIVLTQGNDGNDADGGMARDMMLSPYNFQQKIHYG